MSEERHICPKCGTVLRAEDSEGLCTKCLFGLGMLNGPAEIGPAGKEEVTPSGTVLYKKTPAKEDSVRDTDGLIGKTLGVYEIVEVLGRGGMGIVYKARDHSLDRWVAVKVLVPRLRSNTDFIERFLREAQSAARLSHPNVVPIFGIGDEERHRFYAMEFVRGVNLAAYLQEQGTLPAWQALNLAARVVSALEAAHAEGIVHRDIKPQNIMIDEAGRVRVLDFGLAKMRDTKTLVQTEGGFVGTPSYVSPEQCEGKEVDGRSDLYSLGVVLYECLSGRLPYSGDTPLALFKNIVESDPPPLGKARPGIAQEIEDLVQRLLAKDPVNRFQSASDLLRSIEKLMDDPVVVGAESEESALPRVFLASQFSDKHISVFKECLKRSGGEELGESNHSISKNLGDGRFAAVFKDSMDAIHCAFDFQEKSCNLGAAAKQGARIAIHERDARRPGRDSALLPPPEETLGRPLDTALQMLDLAGPNQILLTHRAFDSARRQPLRDPSDSQIAWLAHGPYRFENLDESLEIFEVGLLGRSPLAAPPDSATAKSATRAGDEITLGWRPAIGREIPSRPTWRLEESLGEGGFCEVWLARHKKSQDRRIFKFCFEADRLRALKREVMLLRLLKETLGDRHDISKLLDWNFDKAPFFIESEYTEGGSLTDWSETQGGVKNVPLETRLDLIAQAATALAAAHSVGVIHKDIKPANVLVAKDSEGNPQAVLADFGIGLIMEGRLLEEKGITVMTELSSGRTTSSTTGTHMYMAPELQSGAPASSQSDIYSLGVLFYQMVAGDLSQPVATDWERNVEDPLLRDDLHHCLAGNPTDRFAGANEVARGIRALPQRRRRRNAARLARVAVAALTLFAVVSGAWLSFQAYQRKQAETALERETGLRSEAERRLYYSHMVAALKHWQSGKAGRLRALLDTHMPRPGEEDLRGWEWHYLNALSREDLYTLTGHEGTVQSVAWSPNGRHLASAGDDGTVRIWDIVTCDLVRTLEGHTSRVLAVAWSPDGLSLASGCADGTSRIWDPATGRSRYDVRVGETPVRSVSWSSDGRLMASASDDGPLLIWDSSTGNLVTSDTQNAWLGVRRVAWNRVGSDFACAGARGLRFFSSDGTELYRNDLGGGWQAYSLAWSPDGTHVAAGCEFSQVSVREVGSTGSLRNLEGHRGPVFSVCWSPDGKRLASASEDFTIRLWGWPSGDEQGTLFGHTKAVTSVAWRPDGRFLASGSKDGTVRIWDPVGRLLPATGRNLGFWVTGVGWSPDSRHVVSARLHQQAHIREHFSWEEAVVSVQTGNIWHADFSPDGKRIATACGGGNSTVRIWNAETLEELKVFEGHTGDVRFVYWSPDGLKLFSVNHHGDKKGPEARTYLPEMIVWDAGEAKAIRTIRGRNDSDGWSPDSRFLAYGAQGGAIHIQDVATGKTALTIERTEGNAVQRVTWSPDGRWIVSCSVDGTIQAWDAKSGENLYSVRTHSWGEEGGIAWSPDGRRIASGAIDGAIKILDALTGEEVLDLPGHHPGKVMCLAWRPDGLQLASGGSDHLQIIWDGRPITPDYQADRIGYSLVRFLGSKGLRGLERIEAIRNDEIIDDEAKRHAYEEASPVRVADLPGDESMDVYDRLMLWYAPEKEFERLAEAWPTTFPVRTLADAQRGEEAWRAYLDEFSSTSRRIAEAKNHRDWYESWLADGATLDAIRNRSSSEEPAAGTLRVVELGNGLNLDLVWIPTGEFIIGSPPNEAGRGQNEGPQTWVPVEGFWMGKYEVTVGQFRQFVKETSHETDAEKVGQSTGPDGLNHFAKVSGLTWREPGFEQTDRHPVVCVSWNDAMAFCRWLSKKTGTTFLLPTEAQAEYTYRAGSTTPQCWGHDRAVLEGNANLADQSWYSRFTSSDAEQWDDGFVFTAPVGSFPPNEWGLHDRLGNANEFCLSRQRPYPYRETDGRNNSSGNRPRARRGGSICDPASKCRSASRHFGPQDYSTSYDGFRVVQLRRTSDPKQPWKTILPEAIREYERLAESCPLTSPIRTLAEARHGADAWSAYLDKFGPTSTRSTQAEQHRDWYESWLEDRATLEAVRDRSASDEPATGTLRVVDTGGGMNLELVWIPTGEFIMGSPPTEDGRNENEGPQAWVPVKGFWMGKYEVTVGQFRRFIEETSYKTDAEKAGESRGPSGLVPLSTIPGLNWQNPGFEQTDRHPAVCISWNDAMAFCRWLSQKTGTSFTLPTEAQAEYTCRVGSTASYPWGDDPDGAQGKTNTADQTHQSRFPGRSTMPFDDGFLFTAPSGSFPPNAWGLFERIGNVNEWCLSLEKPYPYRETDGRNDPEVDGRRAWKGGSNFDPAERYRSARRYFRKQAASSSYVGFRVVLLSE